MRLLRPMSIALCTSALVLSGCGGGGDPEPEQQVNAQPVSPPISQPGSPQVTQASPVPSLLGASTAVPQTCLPVPNASTELRALNGFWNVQVRLCRVFGANNAFARSDLMLVLADQDWLDQIAFRFGSFAATGILAHEWGHIVQGSVQPGTAAELQADCLAGLHFRGAGLPETVLGQFVTANFYAGDPQFVLNGHGTGQQRVNAVQQGYRSFFAGMTAVDVFGTVCPYSAFY